MYDSESVLELDFFRVVKEKMPALWNEHLKKEFLLFSSFQHMFLL